MSVVSYSDIKISNWGPIFIELVIISYPGIRCQDYIRFRTRIHFAKLLGHGQASSTCQAHKSGGHSTLIIADTKTSFADILLSNIFCPLPQFVLVSFENKITHFATLAITIFFISISIAFGKRISIFQQIHTSRPHFQHILQHLSKRLFGCIRQLQTHLRIRTNTQIQQGHST